MLSRITGTVAHMLSAVGLHPGVPAAAPTPGMPPGVPPGPGAGILAAGPQGQAVPGQLTAQQVYEPPTQAPVQRGLDYALNFMQRGRGVAPETRQEDHVPFGNLRHIDELTMAVKNLTHLVHTRTASRCLAAPIPTGPSSSGPEPTCAEHRTRESRSSKRRSWASGAVAPSHGALAIAEAAVARSRGSTS